MTKRGPSNATIWFWLIPFLAVAMRLASSISADFSYVILSAYALQGRAQAIQALFLSWLFTMLSDGVAPISSFSTVGRHFVVLASAFSVCLIRGTLQGNFKVSSLVIVTWLLGTFLVFHSLLFSSFAELSILKSISFILTLTTLLSAWGGLAPTERKRAEKFVFGMLIAVLLVSLPLAATDVGYLLNGTGFQGVLNHPQAFGVTMALLGAWLAGRFLAERHLPWRYALLLAACVVVIILSESRTAGGALVLGVGLPLVVIFVLRPRSICSALPGLCSRFALVVIAASGVLHAVPTLSTGFEHFLTKSGRSNASGLLDVAEESRGFLVYEMLGNIEKKPWSGIGFGAPSSPFASNGIERDPYLGLPLSAGIEKGVLPVAVMEELGIPGFAVVTALFWILIRRAAHGGFVPLLVVTTALLTNLGESTFFSPGGMGLLLHVLTGWASTTRQPEARVGKQYA